MSFSKVLQLRIQLWLVIRVEFSYFECTVCYLHNNRLDLKLEKQNCRKSIIILIAVQSLKDTCFKFELSSTQKNLF